MRPFTCFLIGGIAAVLAATASAGPIHDEHVDFWESTSDGGGIGGMSSGGFSIPSAGSGFGSSAGNGYGRGLWNIDRGNVDWVSRYWQSDDGASTDPRHGFVALNESQPGSKTSNRSNQLTAGQTYEIASWLSGNPYGFFWAQGARAGNDGEDGFDREAGLGGQAGLDTPTMLPSVQSYVADDGGLHWGGISYVFDSSDQRNINKGKSTWQSVQQSFVTASTGAGLYVGGTSGLNLGNSGLPVNDLTVTLDDVESMVSDVPFNPSDPVAPEISGFAYLLSGLLAIGGVRFIRKR